MLLLVPCKIRNSTSVLPCCEAKELRLPMEFGVRAVHGFSIGPIQPHGGFFGVIASHSERLF